MHYSFTSAHDAAQKAATERRKRARRYVFRAVGLDRSDPDTNTPPDGTVVVKTQPFGCPQNGTMGFCYVKNATTGEFHGLVHLASLNPKGQG